MNIMARYKQFSPEDKQALKDLKDEVNERRAREGKEPVKTHQVLKAVEPLEETPAEMLGY